MIPDRKLKNGVLIPVLGLGTWQLKGKECTEVVKKAIDMGYSHIDTAEYYDNHEAIGKAIKDYDREDLFITSKVWTNHMSKDKMINACDTALEELGTDYLDLYLLHWPNTDISREEQFAGLKELYEEGKVKAVGVSNFTINHLREALEASDIPIAMNQVEFHPFLYQKELLEFCSSKGVRMTAYSPIARGKVLEDETLKSIGEVHGKSAVQVSLRWLLQHGLVAIPKSSSEEHLKANMEIFDFKLSDEEMNRIDNLGKNERLIDPGFMDFDY